MLLRCARKSFFQRNSLLLNSFNIQQRSSGSINRGSLCYYSSLNQHQHRFYCTNKPNDNSKNQSNKFNQAKEEDEDYLDSELLKSRSKNQQNEQQTENEQTEGNENKTGNEHTEQEHFHRYFAEDLIKENNNSKRLIQGLKAIALLGVFVVIGGVGSTVYTLGWERCEEIVDQYYFAMNNPTLMMKHYLYPKSDVPHYTVVVDFRDLVLVRDKAEACTRGLVRPFADFFLEQLSQRVELILWCSSDNLAEVEYVEKLSMQFPGTFQSVLSFSECTIRSGVVMKDLTRLNRPLSNVILLTSSPSHATLQPENALYLQAWDGNISDTSLLDIYVFLEYIFNSKHPLESDVRDLLQRYMTQDCAESFHDTQVKFHENLMEKYRAVKVLRAQMKQQQNTLIRG